MLWNVWPVCNRWSLLWSVWLLVYPSQAQGKKDFSLNGNMFFVTSPVNKERATHVDSRCGVVSPGAREFIPRTNVEAAILILSLTVLRPFEDVWINSIQQSGVRYWDDEELHEKLVPLSAAIPGVANMCTYHGMLNLGFHLMEKDCEKELQFFCSYQNSSLVPRIAPPLEFVMYTSHGVPISASLGSIPAVELPEVTTEQSETKRDDKPETENEHGSMTTSGILLETKPQPRPSDAVFTSTTYSNDGASTTHLSDDVSTTHPSDDASKTARYRDDGSTTHLSDDASTTHLSDDASKTARYSDDSSTTPLSDDSSKTTQLDFAASTTHLNDNNNPFRQTQHDHPAPTPTPSPTPTPTTNNNSFRTASEKNPTKPLAKPETATNQPEEEGPTSASTESQLCPCRCLSVKLLSEIKNMTLEVIEELTSSIQKNLTVDTSSLSSTIRLKTSAYDARPTSKLTGIIGVIFLVLIFGSIVIMDLVHLVVHLLCSR